MSSPDDRSKIPGAPSREDSANSAAPSRRAGEQADGYFPEDERCALEWEDDHSHADPDPDAATEPGNAGETRPAGSPASACAPLARGGAGEHLELFHDEDVRPCPDWEDDHSHTDHDVDAEIEAKLGKMPEETAVPCSTGPEASAPSAGAAAAPSRLEESGVDPHEEFHDAEDIRPCPDWEDDHSHTELEPDTESRARPGEAPAAASGVASSLCTQPLASPPLIAAHADDADDERPCLGWEDDHSHTDFDMDAEIEARLGKEGEKKSAAQTVPGSEKREGHQEDNAQMHPDLAASLAVARAFADRGYEPAADSGEPSEADASAASGPEETPSGPGGDASPEDPAAFAKGEPSSGENVDGSLSGSGYLDSGQAALPLSDDASAAGANEGGGEAAAESAPPEAGAEPDEGQEQADNALSAVAGRNDTDKGDAERGGGDDEDSPMSLRDHLRELRKRLLRAFICMLVGFFACYPFAEELFTLLMAPLIKAMPATSKLIYTNPPEAFFTYLKVSFVAGIFLASPLVFYQIWAFVAPGLYKEEKLYIVPVAFFSALFFICGGAFCYFIGFPFVFEFFMSYDKGLIQAMPALSETLSFVLQLLLAFGIVFELPLFVFFLSRLGVITADMMRRFRRYAILVNFIVAAILTPPDVMSQLLMAGPLILLYEISIVIAAVFGKKKPKPEPEDGNEGEDGDAGTEEERGSGEDGAVASAR